MTFDKRAVKPMTELACLIGRKWFLSLEELSARAGVPKSIIKRAVQGITKGDQNERRLFEFLKAYKGEEAK